MSPPLSPKERKEKGMREKQLGNELGFTWMHRNTCGITNDGGVEEKKIQGLIRQDPGSKECSSKDSDCDFLAEIYVECSANCAKGKKCDNRKFSNKQFKKNDVFLSSNGKGRGLKAMEAIMKGELVIEYTGQTFTAETHEKVLKNRKKLKHNGMTYHVELVDGVILDPTDAGNAARFANHSCDPNCIMETWWVASKPRVGFFAIKSINDGDEITWNYGDSYSGVTDASGKWVEPIACLCGAAKCRKFITSEAVAKKLREKKPRRVLKRAVSGASSAEPTAKRIRIKEDNSRGNKENKDMPTLAVENYDDMPELEKFEESTQSMRSINTENKTPRRATINVSRMSLGERDAKINLTEKKFLTSSLDRKRRMSRRLNEDKENGLPGTIEEVDKECDDDDEEMPQLDQY